MKGWNGKDWEQIPRSQIVVTCRLCQREIPVHAPYWRFLHPYTHYICRLCHEPQMGGILSAELITESCRTIEVDASQGHIELGLQEEIYTGAELTPDEVVWLIAALQEAMKEALRQAERG